ncbi:MAG TPA: AarF/UbiB family protein [Thermoleophilia bacterium]|nr:AarF/UbiB family protein [Thermoleophilia bacterium]
MSDSGIPNDPTSSPETGPAAGAPAAPSAPRHEAPRKRRRRRMREILHVMHDEHLIHLTGGADFSEYVSEDEMAPDAAEKDLPEPVRVRHALERLGPVWIKVGQLLSTRRDLIPPALATELAKLQDDVPSLPFDQIRPRIEEELGAPIEELYAAFDTEPLAAASVGHVYRATLHDGTEVAVKVQRPGTTEAMEIDLDLMLDLGRKAAKHSETARDMGVAALTREFTLLLRSELDYRQEAHNMDVFREAFVEADTIYVPAHYPELSTSRVLTMELLNGVSCEKPESMDEERIDRRKIVDNAVKGYLEMLLHMGIYHADPHAGNMFAMPDSRVGIIDWGRVGKLSDSGRVALLDMLMAIRGSDPGAFTQAIVAGSPQDAALDKTSLELAISQAMHEMSIGTPDLADASRQLLTAMQDAGARVPAESTAVLTVVGVLDGVARQIEPSFDLLARVGPFAKEAMSGDMRSQVRSLGTKTLTDMLHLLVESPRALTDILRRAGQGEFKLAVRPTDYDRLVDRLDAIVRRLGMVLLVSALFVGTALFAGLTAPGSRLGVGADIVLVIVVVTAIGLFVGAIREERRTKKTRHGR